MRVVGAKGKHIQGVSSGRFGKMPENQVSQIRGLVSAVLGAAMDDYMGVTGKACQGSPLEARKWLFSPETGEFSMLWCCEVLGLDPTEVRKKIKSGSVTPFTGVAPGEGRGRKPARKTIKKLSGSHKP